MIGSILSKTAAGPESASTYTRGSVGLRVLLFICFFSTLTGVVAGGVGLVFIPCTFLFFVLGRSNMHSRTFLQGYQAHGGIDSCHGQAFSIGASCTRNIHNIGLDRLYIVNINREWAMRSVLVKDTSVAEHSIVSYAALSCKLSPPSVRASRIATTTSEPLHIMRMS